MKSRHVAFLGLFGIVLSFWFFANGCSLDTTGFAETEDVCTADAHCDDSNVCTADTCNPQGVCVHTAVSDGLFPDGVQGNCKALGCEEGVQAEIELKDDVDDGDECTDDTCTTDGATHTVHVNATCHFGGGLGKCGADGKCAIACGYVDDDGKEVGCPTSQDDCTISYCDSAVGQCALDELDGVAKPGTKPGDCGGSYCVKGQTSNTSSLADTPCTGMTPDGKSTIVCDGGGECVECNSHEQCIPQGMLVSFCFEPKCTNHKCENIVKDNVDEPTQSPGDCKRNRCSMGNEVVVNDDADLPDDTNPCTNDLCNGGVPGHTNKSQGTNCGTGANGNPLVCNNNGICVGCNSPADCPGSDDECKARTCDAGQQCGINFTGSGTAVAAQTSGNCMKQVCDGNGNIVAALDNGDVPADDGNQCTDETCNNGVPGHPNKAVGAACNDGNGCTQSDTCAAGACNGANPVICMALDQCHDPGTCNPASGMCSNPNKSNGTSCTDSNACTQMDSCQSGTCVGANPVICSALDQCHNVGTCNVATGVCSNPNKNNGSACGDGNACTQTDTCQSGTCTGANPVVCSALDQCHNAGTCNPANGMCSNPNKADGASCNDANACTQTDTCQSGNCTGANPVVCSAQDQCHNVGTCNVGTGICSNPNKSNGTACNDSNMCTQTDTCQTGVCSGSNPVVCSAMDQCHNVGTCAPATGVCSNPNKSDGSVCNDSNGCTQTDTCQSGTCTGSNPVTCMALDQCHNIGTCNPASGTCSTPAKGDGSVCNDGNMCTQTDTCQSGACTGANPVTCMALDQCHNVGTCNPGSGTCSNPNKGDGTSCNDNNACTMTDTCQSGSCMGSGSVTCTALDSCHNVGTCDMMTGMCSNPPKANGDPCDDLNTCTQTDTCNAVAVCIGSNFQSGGTACTDHGVAGNCLGNGTCMP